MILLKIYPKKYPILIIIQLITSVSEDLLKNFCSRELVLITSGLKCCPGGLNVPHVRLFRGQFVILLQIL